MFGVVAFLSWCGGLVMELGACKVMVGGRSAVYVVIDDFFERF